jgi:integrase
MHPARTPTATNLNALVTRRLAELPPDGLLFPAPRGGWARRSDYGRRIFRPAAHAAGWPTQPNGRLAWTFHSLRHVFATWALAQPDARLEDTSRLLGHSSIRTTQDLYITPDGDLHHRLYQATQ